jgi:hypothetical protein
MAFYEKQKRKQVTSGYKIKMSGLHHGLLKGYKPSYQWPRGFTIVDLLVGLSSLGLSIAVFHWIGR